MKLMNKVGLFGMLFCLFVGVMVLFEYVTDLPSPFYFGLCVIFAVSGSVFLFGGQEE